MCQICLILSVYYMSKTDWKIGRKAGLKNVYLSSLSSLAASFRCFLMSSRLRRASARSLTARSLSLRRLSHNVLPRHSKHTLKHQHQQLLILDKFNVKWYRMLSLSATILSLSWKAQSLRHLATSASCTASFNSWDMASHCFLNTSISLLARSMSSVAESCFCSKNIHDEYNCKMISSPKCVFKA